MCLSFTSGPYGHAPNGPEIWGDSGPFACPDFVRSVTLPLVGAGRLTGFVPTSTPVEWPGGSLLMLWASWIRCRPLVCEGEGALLFPLLEQVCVQCSVMSEELLPNIYYSPEAHGLKTLVSVDFADSYEFEILLALVDPETSVVYLATDSGCSCPSPFEQADRYSFEPCTSPRDVDAYVTQRYSRLFNPRPDESDWSRRDREADIAKLATFQERLAQHVFTQKAKDFARLRESFESGMPPVDPF